LLLWALSTDVLTIERALVVARASWFAGFVVFASTSWLLRCDDVTATRTSLLVALASCAVSAAGPRVIALAPALAVLVAASRIDPLASVATLLALASSLWLAHAIDARKHDRVRLCCHAASFFGTFAVAVPLLVSRALPGMNEPAFGFNGVVV